MTTMMIMMMKNIMIITGVVRSLKIELTNLSLGNSHQYDVK